MDHKSSKTDCTKKCDDMFKECMSRGEHESVCRMQRVPCDCSCSME